MRFCIDWRSTKLENCPYTLKMLAYSEERIGQRRTLGLVIAWWLVSVIGLAILTQIHDHELGLPTSFGAAVYVAVAWLLPGFVLGGWKAILVVAGRTSVTRRRDRIFVRLFTYWVVGWSLIAYALSFSRLGTL